MGGGRLALLSRHRKWSSCCAFLDSDVVLVVQVRSSVMCIPRNFVGFWTLSTVEPSMVSGGGQQSSSWNPSQPLSYSHWGTGCLHHTIQPVVPLPLCRVFHHCCWWGLPQLCQRQTWWCGWSWTWLCSHESAAWRAAGWAHSPVGLTRTNWGLPVRKSRIQLQREAFRPSRFNLLMSRCGVIVLNAELKSMNNTATIFNI